MVRIVQRPLSIEGLKVYKKMSPSKYEAKFGDLDLDEIPEEYMREGMFPVIKKDGSILEDEDNEPVMRKERYFDSVAYRAMILKGKPQTPVLKEFSVPYVAPAMPQAEVKAEVKKEVDESPNKMGDGFNDDKSDVIPESVNLDGGDNLASKRI